MLLQGGGVHWISSDSDDQRTFWSLKCLILGFFFGGVGGGGGGRKILVSILGGV